jgi:hypothetical protein
MKTQYAALSTNASFPTGLFLVAHHKETEDGRCIPLP